MPNQYHQEECFHSLANTEGVSICTYVHVMYKIIRQSGAQNILMIGYAGGALATMLHRIGCNVTVVDINSASFKLAKKYFQMPKEIECILGDGWSYLLETGNRYDAIAVDAFSSDGAVPEQFTTEDFFMVVKAVLNPCGVVTMNVMVDDEFDMFADRIGLNMEAAKIPAYLFNCIGRTNQNIIISGGALDQMQAASYRKPRSNSEW
jgi:spermidine synthase